jgi:hypothetical protein
MTTKMTTKEMKSELKNLEYESKFFLEKLKDARSDAKHGEVFAKQCLAEIEFLLHVSNDLAKELGRLDPVNPAKYRYELMKEKLNLK